MPVYKQDTVCCPHHPDARLIADQESGDIICPHCGLVVGDRLVDSGPEWANHDDGNDKSRVGRAEDPLMDVNDLGTIIGETPRNGVEMSRYARFSGFSSKERSLRAAHGELKDAAVQLRLTDAVVETAFGYYQDVTDRTTFRGAHRDALVPTCLFIASYKEDVPRSVAEVCRATGCPKQRLGRCYKEVFKLLKLRDSAAGREKEFVERFCSNLHLSQELVNLAASIAEAAAEQDLFADRGPDVVCGAAILLACAVSGLPTHMNAVSSVTGASRNGLTVGYKTLLASAESMIPKGDVRVVTIADLPRPDML